MFRLIKQVFISLISFSGSLTIKELRIYKQNSFCVCHRNRRKHNQHFKQLFFTINLHFVISNKTSTYRKLSLSLRSSISLVILPLKMQKASNRQKNTTQFLLCLELNNPQTLKCSSCKNHFLQCVCYWYNLLR